MEVKTYATPKAFMIALNARLKAEAAKSGRAAWRVQQLAIFERFFSKLAMRKHANSSIQCSREFENPLGIPRA